MRRARLTYQGAYHHVMNRGYDGNKIFKKRSDKEIFLSFIKEFSEKLKIRIFAYCIMDNHYHLILENSSGRMSDFLRHLNGSFGTYFRKKHGGRGYVFQDRYKSMLIQDDSYLMISIAYVLNNPVRAKIVNNFLKYEWSSGSLIFNDKVLKNDSNIIDIDYIEDLFSNRKIYLDFIVGFAKRSLPEIGSKIGKIIGGDEFISKAMSKFDRRSGKESMERKRINDKYFDPVKKIIMEFEKKNKLKIEDIDTSIHFGKRLRGELLLNLKDRGGLKYTEIIKMDLFSDVKLNSLGRLYNRAKMRRAERKNVKM